MIKKLLKAVFLLILLFKISFSFSQSQRLVFHEMETNTGCNPCVPANHFFDSLMYQNTSKAVFIKYFSWWPNGADLFYGQAPNENRNRIFYYNSYGVPNGFMDGGAGQIWNVPQFAQTAIDNQYAIPSPFTIQLFHWHNAAMDSIYISCSITASQNINMLEPKIRIAMIEKTVSFTTPPGSNGEKVFHNVVRKMFPGSEGTPLTNTWISGQQKIITFSAPIPAYIFDKNEIATVAWIQDDNTKNVKQAGYSPIATVNPALPPKTDFSADVTSSCNGLVNFTDNSAFFPNSWLWDFGDGTISTLQNPSHKYLLAGSYSVKLKISNANGSDSLIKNSYITINLAGAAPLGVGATRCGQGIVNLTATANGSGTVMWYNSQNIIVNTGPTFSPYITGTTNYIVQEMYPNPISNVGPPDTSISVNTNTYAGDAYGLRFEVLKPCRLISLKVFLLATSNSQRSFNILDEYGNSLDTVYFFHTTAGMKVIPVNKHFKPGKYIIKIGNSSQQNMYSNSSNANYPYTSSCINITDVYGFYSTTSSKPYHFFYDWQIQEDSCGSNASIVTAFTASITATITAVGNVLSANIGQSTYQWYLNGLPIVGATSSTYIASATGNYTVEITDNFGCAAVSAPYTISAIVSVENINISKMNMDIFPSPFSTTSTIAFDLPENSYVSLDVCNLLGEHIIMLYNGILNKGEHKFIVDGTNFPSGLYIIKLNSESNSIIKKIILSK